MLKYLIFLFVVANCAESAKILGVFWTPSKSHHIFASAVLQALAKKGHDVHLISSYNDKVEIPTYKQEKLTGIVAAWDIFTNPNISTTELIMSVLPMQKNLTENFWKNDAVQKILKNKPKYDAVINLAFFNDFTFALTNYLNAPLILISSSGATALNNKFVANPNLPYGRNVILDKSMDTFTGRLATVTSNMMLPLVEKYLLEPVQEEVTKKYIPNAPSIQELNKKVDLILVNAHVSMEEPRPYVPNIIPIGGCHTAKVKKLPENLQKYLDSSTNGVVLFSMGTNVKIGVNFGDKIKILMNSFRKIAPVKILMKSEIEIPTAPENVLVVDWLPQNDVLAHPNVKFFISHGGLGGTTEAVYHGVPMLGIPFFADQKSNIGFAINAGFAIMVDIDSLTEEKLDEAINKLLTNPMYAKNAKKRSLLFRDQPIKPMDKAIWWVEHIIEHKGGEHLRNTAVNFEWYQLYMVDIMLFYLILILVSITISFYTTKWFVKKLYKTFVGCNKKSIEKIKKQ